MHTRSQPRAGQTTLELDYADPARLPDAAPSLRTVDLFCGCGGMSLGFQNAGFEIVAAYDNWEPSLKVYRANFRHPALSTDLSAAEASDEIAKLSPEVIVGGPPCQDFSSAGPQNETGARASLTPAFASIVGRCRPNYFVFENVQRAQLAVAYQSAKSILTKEGYGLTEIVLDAAYCGVPQTRRRLFLVGALGASHKFLEQPLVARLSSKPLTLREYFGDELSIDYYFRIPTNYSKRAIFSVDEPCRTIRAVDRPMPATYKLHPSDPICPNGTTRVLTTRERSMVQTFPPDFVLEGTKTDLNQMIGNAVPVKLAEFIAQALAAYHRETCRSSGKAPAEHS
jgi:DNA (cytosine-5)-methyltransferase 1